MVPVKTRRATPYNRCPFQVKALVMYSVKANPEVLGQAPAQARPSIHQFSAVPVVRRLEKKGGGEGARPQGPLPPLLHKLELRQQFTARDGATTITHPNRPWSRCLAPRACCSLLAGR